MDAFRTEVLAARSRSSGFGHPFQDVAEQHDQGVVAHQHHPLPAAQVVQFAKHGAQPQHNVGPGLAAGRPVVELAQPAPAFGFVREPPLHALAGEHVQDAEFTVSEALVGADLDRPPGGFHCDLGRLTGPNIRGGHHGVGPGSSSIDARALPSASDWSWPVRDSVTSASRAGTSITSAPAWLASVAATLPSLSPCRTRMSSTAPGLRTACVKPLFSKTNHPIVARPCRCRAYWRRTHFGLRITLSVACHKVRGQTLDRASLPRGN